MKTYNQFSRINTNTIYYIKLNKFADFIDF